MAKRRLLQLDLRHLVASYKQCFLTEGVHQDHPGVTVVAIGRGAGLGELVLGREGDYVSQGSCEKWPFLKRCTHRAVCFRVSGPAFIGSTAIAEVQRLCSFLFL